MGGLGISDVFQMSQLQFRASKDCVWPKSAMGCPCWWGVREGRFGITLHTKRGCALHGSVLLAAVGKHEMPQRGSVCGPGKGWPCSPRNNCFLPSGKKAHLLVELIWAQKDHIYCLPKVSSWERTACHRGNSPLTINIHTFVQGGEKVCSTEKTLVKFQKRLFLSQSQYKPD